MTRPNERRTKEREAVAEYEDAGLADRRLDARLVLLAARLSVRPDASFPQAADNDSELEGTYRFLNNARISPESILAPHVRESLRRCARAERLVVAHDTTQFNYGKTSRRDLGRIGHGQSFGFHGHFALAIDAQAAREPLGVVGLVIHRRSPKRKPRRTRVELQLDPTNEGLRWRTLIDEVRTVLDGRTAIHVMDREADSYHVLSALIRNNMRFVVRMGTNRALAEPGVKVSDVLDRAPVVAEREVPLTPRGRSLLPARRKRHPPRAARVATLSVSSGHVVIKRSVPASRTPEKELVLNCVRVWEPRPPVGETPVEWRLWTTEPVDTPEQMLRIVDDYRCRWRIEEYFKALKTGCALESRQLETHRALVNAVALFVPIAWRLLRLRTLGRPEAEYPAAVVLTPIQVRCLRSALKKLRKPLLPSTPTARDVLLGIAALGGHLRQNGDPGWIVLGRGLEDLLKIELGFTLASEM